MSRPRLVIRNADPRPIRLERCFEPRCKAFIPPWRTACWKHEQEMRADWPVVCVEVTP